MTHNNRINQLEDSVLPQHVFFLWMNQAHKFHREVDYLYSITDTLQSAHPKKTLPTRARKSAEKLTLGKPSKEIDSAVQEAVLDVHYLLSLHDKTNHFVSDSTHEQRLRSTIISKDIQAMLKRESSYTRIKEIRVALREQIPYPLSQEAHAALQAAAENRIIPWPGDPARGTPLTDWIRSWLVEHFIHKAKTPVEPATLTRSDLVTEQLMRHMQEDGKELVPQFSNDPIPSDVPNLMKTFKNDQKAMMDYLHERDFTRGLADVRDREFKAKEQLVVDALRNLVGSGEIQAGMAVHFPTIPHRFLADVPIIDGEWVDKYVIALSIYGALLLESGFRFVSQETNPAAWQGLLRPTEDQHSQVSLTELWACELDAVREDARTRIQLFSGATKVIDGREYINFHDFQSWSKHNFPGDPVPIENIRGGFQESSWINWCSEKEQRTGAPPTLAGVTVHPNEFPIRFQARPRSSKIDIQRDLKQIEEVISDLESLDDIGAEPATRTSRLKTLRDELVSSMVDVLSVKEIVTAIDQRYFKGLGILWSEQAQELEERFRGIQTSVRGFNTMLAMWCSWNREEEHLTNLQLDPSTPVAPAECDDMFIDWPELSSAAEFRVKEGVNAFVNSAKIDALEGIGEYTDALNLLKREKAKVAHHLNLGDQSP